MAGAARPRAAPPAGAAAPPADGARAAAAPPAESAAGGKGYGEDGYHDGAPRWV
jgi:hypothetical protein